METEHKLEKKTKSEIIETYNELMAKYDTLRQSATNVTKVESQAVLTKTKELSTEGIMIAISDLKLKINQQLNSLADNLSDQLGQYKDLSQAIEISQEKLKVQNGIEIAADTLDRLVKDFAENNQKLEKDYQIKETELDQSIERKRNEWQTEAETHQFRLELNRKKEQEEYNYENQKKIKAIEEREQAVGQKENELISLKQEAEVFPEKLNQALEENNQKWQETVDRQVNDRLKEIEQERKSEKALIEIRTQNLEQTIENQQTEITSLRSNLDKANQRAQDLAAKVVEGASMIGKSEPKTVEPKS